MQPLHHDLRGARLFPDGQPPDRGDSDVVRGSRRSDGAGGRLPSGLDRVTAYGIHRDRLELADAEEAAVFALAETSERTSD